MKYVKYLAIALILVAVVATVINSRRDTIARGLANKVLRQYGVHAEGLAIERMSPTRLELSKIYLVQENGMRYVISGLSFPVSFPSEDFEQVSIEQLSIIATDSTESAPPQLAELFELVASLPSLVPNSRITVGELSVAGLRPFERIEWRSEGEGQELAFSVDSLAVGAGLSRSGASSHRADLEVTAGGVPAFSEQLGIESTADGYVLAGSMQIELAPWLPLLKAAGLVSPATASVDGRLGGELRVDLPRDQNAPALIEASLLPAGELSASYRRSDDFLLTLRSVSETPFELRLGLSDLEWTLEQAHSNVVAGIGLPLELPLEFDQLECHSGIRCTVAASVSIEAFDDGDLGIRNLAMSAPLTIDIGEDAAEAVLSPETTLSIGAVRLGDSRAGSITTTHFSGGRLRAETDGWSAGSDAVDLSIGAIEFAGGVTASAPVSIRDLSLDDSGGDVAAGFVVNPGEPTLRIPGLPELAPGVEGELELHGDDLSSHFTILGDRGDELANVAIEYDTSSRGGSALVSGVRLDMNRKKLSQYWRNWPYEFDVVSGEWTAEAELAWKPDGEEQAISGAARHAATNLSGSYGDIAFADLSTSQRFDIGPGAVSHQGPAELTIGLLEVGVPIEDIEVEYTLDALTRSVRVSRASASLMGGKMLAESFDYEPDAESTTVRVVVESIQLPFIARMIDFEAVSLSGSVSGLLPVTLSGETLTVAGGKLQSDPPGGAIRYSSGEDSGEVTSNIGIVMRSLSNFEYESLTSDVDYDQNGDLKLKMRLTGTNPDVDPLQPVILNLGLENNIPEMLESLQVTRAVEDVLRRRAETRN